MSRYRIKAYFMHEHEQAAASDAVNNATISEAEWTEGYVMGLVDEPQLKKLTKKGLVVSVVERVEEEPAPAATVLPAAAASMERLAVPGVATLNVAMAATTAPKSSRPIPVTYEKQTAESKVLSHDENRAQYYVVRFHGPITAERRRALVGLKVKLLERLSRNKFTAKLTPTDVKNIADLAFVDCLRLYTSEDTFQTIAESGDAKTKNVEGSSKPRQNVYSVRVHDKKYMADVVKWLASRKKKPLWKRGDQFQVMLLEGSKMLAELVARPDVAIVEAVEPPKLFDQPARTILGIIRKKFSIGLLGDGQIVGIADTGIDDSHPDLASRITGKTAWGRPGDTSDPEGHGTHVAGCVAGDGTASNGEIVGAAPNANVFFQSILDVNGNLGGLPPDIGELLKEAYDAGARIHNNSWGAYGFSGYLQTSMDIDKFVSANPDMLAVIAAGNEGLGIARKLGDTMNAANGFIDWASVAAPASAKNGLTVGASRNSRTSGGYSELTWGDAWPDKYPSAPIANDLISGDDQCIAAFSSRGPTDDWRIKPDVVAPGTDIAAARSKDAPLHKFWGSVPNRDEYAFMGGTSMAAPYVAGCAALVREWYVSKANWPTPSAALLKATLINGTTRVRGKDAVAEMVGEPNFHQGFGRINMATTLPSPMTPKLKVVFDDTWKDPTRVFQRDGGRFRYKVKVGDKLSLRICLCWTDPPGRALQHRLTLIVDDSAGKKWMGNADVPVKVRISGAFPDPDNNVQIVRVEVPAPGDYTIAIFGSNMLFPPQAFAVVVSGDVKSDLERLP